MSTAPSSYIEAGVFVSPKAAYILAKLFNRDVEAKRLDEAGIPESFREPAIDVLDGIKLAAAAWSSSELGTAELPKAQEPSESIPMSRTVSTTAAAAELGVSDRYVRTLIDAGELPAQREGRYWRIEAAAVAGLAAERRQRGGS